tara:strand:+ start:76 stop:1191 length:1116 start_codon:yes stop_codon:yes gene_type:complete
MGLTKHMSTEEIRSYPKLKHKLLFVNEIGNSRTFLNVVTAYIKTFYASYGVNHSSARYLSWFSNNVLLNHSFYKDFSREVKVIHVTSFINNWLAIISHTRTWDCIAACKFWILNNLFVNSYAQEYNSCLILDSNKFLKDTEKTKLLISDFLKLDHPFTLEYPQVPGFITKNTSLLAEQEKNALDIHEIYKDNKWYKLAYTFDAWNRDFLAQNSIKELLNQFSDFWNTTSHTNFDWIGPIGDEVIRKLNKYMNVDESNNLNYDFYHNYFTLNSDNYDSVRSNMNHYLGSLEAKIILPPLPYFIRICIEYFCSISRNNIKLHHSYISPREGILYNKLISEEMISKIASFGLTDKFNEMEDLLTRANEICTRIS